MTHATGKYTDFEGLREQAVALRRTGLSRRQIRDRLHVVLQFINSDPNVICFFLRWLDVLGVERERLRFRVSIHESANAQEAEEFWAGLAGVAPATFQKASQEAQPEDKPQEHLGGISRLPDRLRAQERRLVPSHGRRLVRHSRRRRSAT
ncbi:hypothetical protein [Streptomyces violarus]|uniref:hypothetical protein n=1 Tax=Streptomyces violarus TaxID=67380 RepID=UPI003704CBED